MKKNRFLLLIAIAFFCSFWTIAQQDSIIVKKPKIGLVLSGGGAKGLAHIGAIKVIDSLGIKVDYIAGTSMGAIVGSLYASGYTGVQLDSIFETVDFDNIISDDIPRSAKSSFERYDNERYAITLPFKNFKVKLPSSLSKGQNVYNLLSRLLSHVRDVDDFSKMPIPFLCVATDIETGEEIVLENGYLPRAVNASGALPSLFAPVEIDGRQLIDGGVTDNYPVEKLRARGMDIIIGVDVQDTFKTGEELTGALDILAQINNFRTINAMKEKSLATDVYIRPAIEGFTIVSFDDGKNIIEEGTKAATAQIPELKKLSTNYIKPQLTNVSTDSIHIDNIEIYGNEDYSRSYIKGRFKVKTPGDIAYSDIKNGINNLQATANFTKINYIIVDKGDKAVLQIEVRENEVRNSLRLGIHYDELLRSAAILNLTRKRVLFKNDLISADLIVGDNLRYNFDYYIDKGRYWSVGLHSDYVQFEQVIDAGFATNTSGVPLNVNAIDLEYRDWTQQLFLQTSLLNSLDFIGGVEFKSLDIFTRTVLSGVDDEERLTFQDSRIASLYGKVNYDSYNNPMYPTAGWKVSGDFHFYGANSRYGSDFNQFSIAQLSVGHADKIGPIGVRGMMEIGLPIGDPSDSGLDFFLGGYGARTINNFRPFYGYDFISIGGDTMIKALFELDYEIFRKNHIVFSANLASVEDDLFSDEDWLTNARYTGYAIGYGLETFLGPIELKYSFSPQNNNGEFFANLGFKF